MANTLIVRHNRIGDAIIPLPLIRSLAEKYPDDTFAVVSNSRLKYLFDLMPENVSYIPMVTKAYTGMFRGIDFVIRRKLFLASLKKKLNSFDKIALFQDDTIAKYILSNLPSKQIQVSVVDETEFHSPQRKANSFNDNLTMIGLYKDCLANLGYSNLTVLDTPDAHLEKLRNKDITALLEKLQIDPLKKLIAIAPFSQEITKTYPIDKMEDVVAYFAQNDNQYQVLIIGGGPKEKAIADNWAQKYPNVVSLIGIMSFKNEVDIIAKCSVGITMDSSNLHLMSFLNVPIVSVWGATSPQCGFFPEKEPIENTVMLNLDCQPCTAMGGNSCANDKHLCLNIPPQLIIDKVEAVLTTR